MRFPPCLSVAMLPAVISALIGHAAWGEAWPMPQWTRASPAEMGMDKAVLEQARDYVLRPFLEPMQDAYEFFARLDQQGQPTWTSEIAERGAVFVHRGKCYRTSASYNTPLRRYLLCQTHLDDEPQSNGGLGIYDAPEPWGPWTTVYFTENWDVDPGETIGFPTKWTGKDGKTLYLVFSGDDTFAVRKATLK